jgi:hypothetical protein
MCAITIIALGTFFVQPEEEEEYSFLTMIGSYTWDNYLFNFKMPHTHTSFVSIYPC